MVTVDSGWITHLRDNLLRVLENYTFEHALHIF